MTTAHDIQTRRLPAIHRDLTRPRWSNLTVVGGVMLFWVGFLLWLFK